MDMGDKGNMWTFDNIPCDKIITSIGEKAVVSTTVNGPLCVKFRAELKMMLPKDYDFAKQQRNEVLTEMPVTVEFTLKKGSKFLEVNTTIDNTVCDHYFKVCMPTGLDAEKTYAEGSFMVCEYPTKPSVIGEVRGNELARHPFQLWCDTIDKKNGFAILSDATKDYEILENDENCTIAMGLVRGTRLRIACDNRLWMEYPGDESTQDLKKLSYRYAFMPHTDNWENAKLYNEGLAFSAPLKVCEFGKQEGIFDTEKSFVAVDGDNLILSSVTKSEENSTIIRLYNPTEKTIDGKIKLGFNAERTTHIRLDGKEIEELKLKDNTISVKVGKGKIYTVEIL